MKGNLLHALGRVVPSHLLDRALAERAAQATGADPWLDAEDDEGGCDEAGVVQLLGGPKAG